MSAAKCVHQKHTRYGRQQCSRAAKVDGYCTQHHPDAVTARKVASNAKFKADFAAQMERSAEAAARVKRGKDALEALAVVADLLADLSRARRVETWEPPTPDATSPGTGGDLTDDERAALATLAKIAEGK